MVKLEVITFFVVYIKPIVASAFSNSTDSVTFHQTDDKILKILDDLFIALKINKNFSKSKNVDEYMSRHSLIQDALCNNRKKYKEIRDMSKTEISHKTAYYIFNINEVVDDMIRKEIVVNDVNVRNVSKNYTLADESPGFVNLARRFNMKLNTLAVPKLLNTKSIQDEGRRIFEGSSTGIERYPFVVSVHVAGRFVCAGSLLHESLTLSAASCLMRPADVNAEIQIRVGSDYVSKMGYLVNIEELIFHPQFDRTTLANNLVLLRTRKALQFIYQKVVAIKYDMAPESALKSNAEDVIILGWGRRKMDGADLREEDRPLSEARLEMYDFSACQYIYTRDFVTDKTFCAGFVDRGAGACNHDGGGPAVVFDVLVGVISFGSPQCGAAEAPTVFTRLGAYDQWIASVIQRLAQNPDIISDKQMNVSENVLSENILNLDQALKDVYRENFNVDDVLYGPIETLYDSEMLNISNKSFLREYPSDPSMFPNPKLIKDIPNPKTPKPIEIPDGYWRDSSIERTDPRNENNKAEEQFDTNIKTEAIKTTDQEDRNKIYVYGSEDIYVDNVASTTVPTLTTKAAREENHYNNVHNDNVNTNPKENCDLDYTLCKDNKKKPTTSERSILRENPVISGFNIDTSHHSQPIIRLFEDTIGKSEKDQGELKEPTNPNIESDAEDEMAVIVLSDSGTTQRIEVHRKDPLYEGGIKTLAAKIVRTQELA